MEHEESDALLQDQQPEPLQRPYYPVPLERQPLPDAVPPRRTLRDAPQNPFDTGPIVQTPRLVFDERVMKWLEFQDDDDLLRHLNHVIAGYCSLLGTFLSRWEMLWRDLSPEALDLMKECFRWGRRHRHSEQFQVWLAEASDPKGLTADNLFIDAGRPTFYGAIPKIVWVRLFLDRSRFYHPIKRRRIHKLIRLVNAVYNELAPSLRGPGLPKQ